TNAARITIVILELSRTLLGKIAERLRATGREQFFFSCLGLGLRPIPTSQRITDGHRVTNVFRNRLALADSRRAFRCPGSAPLPPRAANRDRAPRAARVSCAA